LGESLVGCVGADEVDILGLEQAVVEAERDEPERALPLLGPKGVIQHVANDHVSLCGAGCAVSGRRRDRRLVPAARRQQRGDRTQHPDAEGAAPGPSEELPSVEPGRMERSFH
jgi:hypothetical protein